jgi:hypothetical protein
MWPRQECLPQGFVGAFGNRNEKPITDTQIGPCNMSYQAGQPDSH